MVEGFCSGGNERSKNEIAPDPLHQMVNKDLLKEVKVAGKGKLYVKGNNTPPSTDT